MCGGLYTQGRRDVRFRREPDRVDRLRGGVTGGTHSRAGISSAREDLVCNEGGRRPTRIWIMLLRDMSRSHRGSLETGSVFTFVSRNGTALCFRLAQFLRSGRFYAKT